MIDTNGRPQTDRLAPEPAPPALEVFSNGANGDREEFTFVPGDAVGDELLTTWITADSEDVVDLVDCR